MDTCTDMCMDMCMDICMDMCIRMCMGMCVDMYADMGIAVAGEADSLAAIAYAKAALSLATRTLFGRLRQRLAAATCAKATIGVSA